MNLFIKKLSFSLLAFSFVLVSCTTEQSLEITSPEASFTLQEPGISGVYLNFSLPDNTAFTISWNDELTGSSSYTIEMSLDDAFTSPVTLGTSSTNSFSISVQDLNAAIRNAGATVFKDVQVFLRVNAGSVNSNSIVFLITTYPIENPQITSPADASDFILSDVTENETAITIEWDDSFSPEDNSTTINYYVEAAVSGTDFATIVEMGNTQGSTLTMTHAELNDIALSLGLEPESIGYIDLRVRSVIEMTVGNLERISDPITITITPYDVGLALSTWGIVGSAAPNGWDGPDTQFIQSSTDGVLVAFVKLTDGAIKFRENNTWTNNYGDDGANGTLEAGGADITVTAGSYKVTLNLNNLTYSLELYTWGIVGSAALNGWDGPDFPLVESSTPGIFVAYTILSDGEIKFRKDNDWGNNYGDDGANGTLEPGGANIAVTAGTYKIIFNTNDLTYSVEAYSWGVVGSAAPNSWDGPDVKLQLDYTSDGTKWYNKSVTLADGQIKFRLNNLWDNNYGDDGANGTLEAGGANIDVSAGSYSISINLADLTYKLSAN